MNILFFIRLLLKHTLLLIISPIILVVLVFYLTKNQPKEYVSSTRVYTGITTGSSIVSLENSKVDLFATRTAFDNLINIINARSTLEEVGLRLLATHLLMDKPNPEFISKKSFNNLEEIIPEKIKQLVVKGDLEATINNLRDYKNSNYNNFIYKLINHDHKHYSSKKISANTKIRRAQSSDLIDVTYTSDDPGICKSTLEILTNVFIEEYTLIKVNQSDAVVKYFQDQLDHANSKLNDAEKELLRFNMDNAIINYYEQTRHISAEKKDFDLRYLEVKLVNAGAKSAIAALESKMSERQKQRVTNQSIGKLREKLSRVNYNIAMKAFEESQDTLNEIQNDIELGNLMANASQLENELREKVQEQYNIDNSKEGIRTKSILEDWVEKVIEMESSQAQLKVAEAEEKQFNKLYISYAPLGATLKRLERKIGVAEQEYLSLLHNLGVAKLNQQNVELNSNIKVVTKPLFPIIAQPGKRKILLIIAFLLGFIIPASIIILLEFLDQNIKTAQRAESFSGLSVAAIFPNLSKVNKKLDVDFIKKRALEVISRRLILNNTNTKNNGASNINLVFSILDDEGKTTLLQLLLEKLSSVGYSTLYLTNKKINNIHGTDIRYYNIGSSFHKNEKITDLDADFEGLDINNYDFVFIEVPGILNHSYPIGLFKNTGHSFLVTRANRAWTKSDSNALKDIIEFAPDKKPQILLNGVEMAEMETVIGDLPKRRSAFRRKMKNLLRLQFFSKNQINSKTQENRKTTRVPLYSILILCLIALLTSTFYNKTPDNSNLQTPPPTKQTPGEKPDPEDNKPKIEASSEKLPAIANEVINNEVEPLPYYVICGSFSNKEYATILFTKLKQLGYFPCYVKRSSGLFSVALGNYKTEAEAVKSLGEYLFIQPGSDAWVYDENK